MSRAAAEQITFFGSGTVKLMQADCMSVMQDMPSDSVQAIVTDPPYGLVEYSAAQQQKLRSGRGGVWRMPPALGGCVRRPVPRFTTLTGKDLSRMDEFFEAFGHQAIRVLAPGGNLVMASHPLIVHIVTGALARAGFEPRGQIIRLVQTLRGGDRPKGCEGEFAQVSVMPRSQYEPWIIMRRPLQGTAAASLREFGTGGWRRISTALPFGDVIKAPPAGAAERRLCPHPSLKPQALMRQLVRGALPLGQGCLILLPGAAARWQPLFLLATQP